MYMDLCCFNRPYDDQSSELIHLETEGKLIIQEAIRKGDIDLVWSFILMFENSANPNQTVAKVIANWQSLAVLTIGPHDHVLLTAQTLTSTHHLDPKDALHAACAIQGNCNVFLTVDKRLTKRLNISGLIKAMNPLDFLITVEEPDE